MCLPEFRWELHFALPLDKQFGELALGFCQIQHRQLPTKEFQNERRLGAAARLSHPGVVKAHGQST